MNIQDLRIGDMVQGKATKFPMTVVGIFTTLGDGPKKGTVNLDFDGNDGKVFEENVEDLEFCDLRYHLKNWAEVGKSEFYCPLHGFPFKLGYHIDGWGGQYFRYTVILSGDLHHKVGEAQTLAEAKALAETHLNEMVNRFLKGVSK